MAMHNLHRDENYGFQLYQSDPSGNYGGWKAVAIGAGHAAAQNLLKTDYKEDAPLSDCVPLIIKVRMQVHGRVAGLEVILGGAMLQWRLQ